MGFSIDYNSIYDTPFFIWKLYLIPFCEVFRWGFFSLQDLCLGQTFPERNLSSLILPQYIILLVRAEYLV
jgi:hypothetical protein